MSAAYGERLSAPRSQSLFRRFGIGRSSSGVSKVTITECRRTRNVEWRGDEVEVVASESLQARHERPVVAKGT